MGRRPAERMVAISVIVPKSMYELLKAQASEKNTVVAEVVRSVLDGYLGEADQEKIDQALTMDLIREALSNKDAIAEAISKAIKGYLDTAYEESAETLRTTSSST